MNRLAALKQRGRWIYQQLREFRAQLTHVRPRQYISGESHYYLGKQYVLKVIEAPDELQKVRLLRGKLEVSVRVKSAEKTRELLHAWYKARAREVLIDVWKPSCNKPFGCCQAAAHPQHANAVGQLLPSRSYHAQSPPG
jgi:predicted metal-dependent hydrolase